MRAVVGLAVALGLVAATGTPAVAQDDGDVAAWFGMMLTPYGGLPPLVTPMMFVGIDGDDTGGGFEARYGHWAFDDVEEPWNIFGAGGRAGPIGFTFGYAKCEGCEDGVYMGAVEFENPVVRSAIGATESGPTMVITLRPSLGFAKPGGNSQGNAFSAAVDVPFALNVPAGGSGRFAVFVTPGYGYGRFTEDTEAEGGTRASVAIGAGYRATNGLAVHAAWRKIFIDEGPATLGFGVSFGG
jgi:hypothetical protein